jgi:hypothetical protein
MPVPGNIIILRHLRQWYAGRTCEIQLVAYGAIVVGFHVPPIETLTII